MAALVGHGASMKSLQLVSGLVLVVGSVVSSGCLEQYDPTKNNAKFAAEWQQSTQPTPKLTQTGEIPVAGAGQEINIAEKYQTLCVGCHGAKGQGDGPAGAAMNPKPRNLTDKAWQGSVDDARIAKVIAEGGASVGLSPMMAPWGAVLSGPEITAMVKHVRDFGK